MSKDTSTPMEVDEVGREVEELAAALCRLFCWFLCFLTEFEENETIPSNSTEDEPCNEKEVPPGTNQSEITAKSKEIAEKAKTKKVQKLPTENKKGSGTKNTKQKTPLEKAGAGNKEKAQETEDTENQPSISVEDIPMEIEETDLISEECPMDIDQEMKFAHFFRVFCSLACFFVGLKEKLPDKPTGKEKSSVDPTKEKRLSPEKTKKPTNRKQIVSTDKQTSKAIESGNQIVDKSTEHSLHPLECKEKENSIADRKENVEESDQEVESTLEFLRETNVLEEIPMDVEEIDVDEDIPMDVDIKSNKRKGEDIEHLKTKKRKTE